MIRDKLMKLDAAAQKGFRLRGVGEMARIEAFSDAVFAFAVTLLIVSLEVPKTFNELAEMMRGFIAFAISFALLFQVWVEHYKYFRRYGLQDNFTVWMSGLLLFVVLFYVYPLKFLWTLTINAFMGRLEVHEGGRVEPMIEPAQVPYAFAIFGIGFAAVFFIFVLFYLHAYRKREQLDLNEVELHDTREKIQEHLINSGIGLISTLIALGSEHFNLWMILPYWLIGPVQAAQGMMMGRRRRKLIKSLETPEATGAEAA
jgi:uncharacterized membrane protein